MDWHYTTNAVQYGPVSEDQLRAMAAQRTLKSTDLVWRTGMAGWVQADAVPGLLSPAPLLMPVGGGELPAVSRSIFSAVPAATSTYTNAPFFPVSPVKLAVLSLCTLGLYQVYWMYKNWEAVKARTYMDIRPFWRAVFTVLFCYSLFKEVNELARDRGITTPFSPGLCAVSFITLLLAARLPGPYFLISYASCLALLPVQMQIDRVNAKAAPAAPTNRRFSALNILGIVAGGPFLLLVIYGALMPA